MEQEEANDLWALFLRLAVHAALVLAFAGWCVGQFEETGILYSNSSHTFQIQVDDTGWRTTGTLFVSHPSWQITTWANREAPWQQIKSNVNKLAPIPGFAYDWSPTRWRLSARHDLMLSLVCLIFVFRYRCRLALAGRRFFN